MGLAYTDAYSFNDRYRAFYRERARGGVGLMLVGPVAIDRVGSAPFMPALFEDKYIEPFKEFMEELHTTTGVKLGTQLFHMGRNAFSAFTGIQPIAPSELYSPFSGETPREMTKEDIEKVKHAFALAARRVKEACFDFVEILGCTGYLISQFLSPLTNKRTDEYGGPIENRMRFGLEVIKQVRKAVGNDFPVGIRIAGNDFLDGGHTNIESAMFAAAAQDAGVDAINVTGGWHETNVPQLTTDVPPGAYVYLAQGIKEKVRIPVFASNRLGDPYVAERALRARACDMVCWARPLIADPELPNKVREGRLDEIVPCIACNQGCFDSIFSGASVCCVLNPRAGREEEFKLEKVRNKLKVMVAGGGPAGMEFALTAAKRGHAVSLYEQKNFLGGQINLAKAPPRKHELGKIIESMKNRMERYGVAIKFGAVLTPEMVKEQSPDVLVVATGAMPQNIFFPGIDKSHVVSAWDVLMEQVPDIGNSVVIVGGSATGCETAHFIASMGAPNPETFTHMLYHGAEGPNFAIDLLHHAGRKITVIDMVDRLADNVGRTARWSLMRSLRFFGVELRPSTKLVEITDDGVVVESNIGREFIPADTVIMAVGAHSVNELTKEIEDDGIKLITIGDTKEPRKITEAVREGFEEALKI
jgi:2,4-dienoyl-CoA reductase (NADPH2)